jgi:hypothetical protein
VLGCPYQVRAQLQRILVAVDRYRVLYRGFQQLVLVVGEDRHRAAFFTRKIPTVNEFPDHSSSIFFWFVLKALGTTNYFWPFIPLCRTSSKLKPQE